MPTSGSFEGLQRVVAIRRLGGPITPLLDYGIQASGATEQQDAGWLKVIRRDRPKDLRCRFHRIRMKSAHSKQASDRRHLLRGPVTGYLRQVLDQR
ncbi:MAG: hypothetical protein M5T61_19970 [Acidimicrobiia bacterium]|nr:hypothetical protein [Acidimicrobiia bacterium]